MKKYSIGQSASLTKVATREAVDAIIVASGDDNPIHWDEEYASSTMFKGCIAHGLFYLGMVSTVIGTIMPGKGSILASQQIEYFSPIYIGDEVTTTVTISEIDEEKNLIHLSFTCTNQKEKTIAEGKSLVKMI